MQNEHSTLLLLLCMNLKNQNCDFGFREHKISLGVNPSCGVSCSHKEIRKWWSLLVCGIKAWHKNKDNFRFKYAYHTNPDTIHLDEREWIPIMWTRHTVMEVLIIHSQLHYTLATKREKYLPSGIFLLMLNYLHSGCKFDIHLVILYNLHKVRP